jgi:hypothetical protein
MTTAHTRAVVFATFQAVKGREAANASTREHGRHGQGHPGARTAIMAPLPGAMPGRQKAEPIQLISSKRQDFTVVEYMLPLALLRGGQGHPVVRVWTVFA